MRKKIGIGLIVAAIIASPLDDILIWSALGFSLREALLIGGIVFLLLNGKNK